MAKEDLRMGLETFVLNLKQRYKGWEGYSQFEGTPERLERMYEEFCWTPEAIKLELDKVFRKFDQDFEEMIIGGPFTVFSLCPHHFLPCRFTVFIGYVPKLEDEPKVLGLSKLGRIAEILGKRPILQEQYTKDITDVILENLGPEGVAVSVTGEHNCMTSRGIKQPDARIVTNMIKGSFLDEEATRNEFLSFARAYK